MVLGLIAGGLTSPALAVDPWADVAVDYTPGVGAVPGFSNPASAVGSPSRFSADANPDWSSVVSPFSPAYLADQVVSIGAGGSLTLRFDEPVTNDASNPYGVDLLVFGNAFYSVNFVTGITNGTLGGTNTAGVVEVSQNGTTWFTIPNALPDSYFPTMGYSDLTNPFSGAPGLVDADFTKPVDPAFNAAGMDYAGILAGYNGSGGGLGVSLDLVALPWISYVRLSLPEGATGAIEIDGVSDVAAIPAPGALLLGAMTLVVGGRRRR